MNEPIDEKEHSEESGDEEISHDENVLVNESLKYKYIQQKGHFIIASNEIGQREPLLKKNAYVSAFFNHLFMDYCNLCTMKVTNRFVPCKSCSGVVYCTEKFRNEV